eukprot:scaffold109065_cov75-Phaeocystis_antarctica.AAC.6
MRTLKVSLRGYPIADGIKLVRAWEEKGSAGPGSASPILAPCPPLRYRRSRFAADPTPTRLGLMRRGPRARGRCCQEPRRQAWSGPADRTAAQTRAASRPLSWRASRPGAPADTPRQHPCAATATRRGCTGRKAWLLLDPRLRPCLEPPISQSAQH